VEKFTPQGTVKNIRQVRVQFSEPMVPFGDPRDLAEPFTVSCPEKGTARWADPKNWVYDFEKDLPAGIRCEFTLKPVLKTLSGKEITEAKTFAFSTGARGERLIPNQGNKGIEKSRSSSSASMLSRLDRSSECLFLRRRAGGAGGDRAGRGKREKKNPGFRKGQVDFP
jgi:hypothetical protein